MPEVVGIRFRQAGKIYYFDPTGFEDLKAGTYIVVDTARGEDVGWVVLAPRQVVNGEVVGQLKGILRRAEPWDLLQMQHFRDREEEALEKCRQKIAEYNLPMKVIKAEHIEYKPPQYLVKRTGTICTTADRKILSRDAIVFDKNIKGWGEYNVILEYAGYKYLAKII